MKNYNLQTVFTFGKFSSKTLQQVFEIQPDYIDWCIINLEHFFISDNVIEEIKKRNPQFKFSEQALQKLKTKMLSNEEKNKKLSSSNSDKFDNYNEMSYSEYGGAYGYDDDTINSAFEGDPENYWNID